MTNELFWHYEFDCALHALKAWVHEARHWMRAWAGCKIFRFDPERESFFLLTSPFIERIYSMFITRV
jgi:hypothetical protein